MNTKEFFESHTLRGILLGAGSLLVLLLVFQAGLFVGYHKAEAAYRWGESYYQTFGRPHGPMQALERDDLPMAHGMIGTVVKIALPTITLESSDHVERDVVIASSTIIRQFRDTIGAGAIHVGDQIVVFGSPDHAGHIEAALVRLMAPPTSPSSTAPVR